jgi:hypothetical protein
MVSLDPHQSFSPLITKAFKGEEIIVVKDALGGQPISRWCKNPGSKHSGDLYDSLITKVKVATQAETLSTITFIWMQGETDAKGKSAYSYAENLRGLIGQLRRDLKRKDVNFVIGRLSDFSNEKTFPHWSIVRKAQVMVAESDPRGAWIDTDGLNIPNDVHYTAEGYRILGERFAIKATDIIKRKTTPKNLSFK